jgi:hypothetical protein
MKSAPHFQCRGDHSLLNRFLVGESVVSPNVRRFAASCLRPAQPRGRAE